MVELDADVDVDVDVVRLCGGIVQSKGGSQYYIMITM